MGGCPILAMPLRSQFRDAMKSYDPTAIEFDPPCLNSLADAWRQIASSIVDPALRPLWREICIHNDIRLEGDQLFE